MQGLLADVNVQGHLSYLRRLLEDLDFCPVLAELGLQFAAFRGLGLAMDLDDRELWNCCQQQGWVLFTENRNHDGSDSLQATLADSWRPGHLPVLTLANKSEFEHSREYAVSIATDIAELLFGIAQGEYHDRPRIDVSL
jgi:hypothetical protein